MEKTKLIIFDFDGTLYDLKDVRENVFYLEINYLSHFLKTNHINAKSILEKNHIYCDIRKDSVSATAFFGSLGINKMDWLKYKESNFNVKAIKKENSVNINFLKELKKKYRLIIVSTNSLILIKKIFAHLNLDFRNFEEIYCNNSDENIEINKKEVFQNIVNFKKINYDEIISVGDRYQTDILPLIELGGKGILINSPKDIEKELAFLI